MTIKEELEILRGEPIQVFSGDPMDIPCIETSDADKLCQHPVVSVHMITYNHEPYIRQAIEGVMMQKTDFEFELVIGEDCSTDKTREICFEYQKRYPDKIRVLWCDHNLYRTPHPAGGNSARNLAHCRSEFIALCEGDDYWIDPLKLQKQVAMIRQHENVSICFTSAKIFDERSHQVFDWDGEGKYQPGVNDGRAFFKYYLVEQPPWIMTATFLFRKSSCLNFRRMTKGEIFNWNLRLGDMTMILGMASCGDVYYVPDATAVYRQGVGIMTRDTRVMIDVLCVRWYFHEVFAVPYDKEPFMRALFFSRYRRIPWRSLSERKTEIRDLLCVTSFRPVITAFQKFLMMLMASRMFPIFFIRMAISCRQKLSRIKR